MVLTRKYELLKPVNWRHRTILIVDDVIPNFKILEKALLPTQAKIEHAKIGFEGGYENAWKIKKLMWY